ncbi:MAG: NAD-dependent malic enzyme [Candidatus Abyssobacteria bacterium SURF_5]|uniref:NAD-dependent malic enzyme n=1 Tax=Abyssobacteria bacterium (strain SURF_5) TaxID=2093360 RepID=A0A3A4P612_ABYX5|nr:MAG: NAD-dependent malic enzyme [Candidatus Abyssubacteria bacterium SURF_5]
MHRTPSPSYGILIRLEISNKPGKLGTVTSAIGKAGGDIGSIDIIGFGKDTIIRDVVVNVGDIPMGQTVVDEIKQLPGVKVLNVTDRTFRAHQGGKIEIRNKLPLKTREDLSMIYTPGVARVCTAIREDPNRVYDFSIKKNCVAIVTDGPAVLGLGDIGPEAALPVMEGKAMLFKEFGAVDAFPICLNTKNPDEIVSAVRWIAPAFGGINLEDISSPRCFEMEERLKKELDIPVFHDDQHGTAVVILAGLINALKLVDKRLEDIRIAVCGLGAAGIASIRLLLAAGVKHIVGSDRAGILYRGRKENMNPQKELLARQTNPEGLRGSISIAMKGADVFLGLSQPCTIGSAEVERMAKGAIVFAMANPDPEILPEDVGPNARIVATGRSDYPNQINNVLCFPGLFRGLLDCHAKEINNEMLFAAAHAIASVVAEEELTEDYIIPSVLNRQVPEKVARAVRDAAIRTGVARLEEHYLTFYRV